MNNGASARTRTGVGRTSEIDIAHNERTIGLGEAVVPNQRTMQAEGTEREILGIVDTQMR